jgi:hypothetical protein
VTHERPVVPSSLGRVCASVIHRVSAGARAWPLSPLVCLSSKRCPSMAHPVMRHAGRKWFLQHHFHLGLAPTQVKSACKIRLSRNNLSTCLIVTKQLKRETSAGTVLGTCKVHCFLFIDMRACELNFICPQERFLFIYCDINILIVDFCRLSWFH